MSGLANETDFINEKAGSVGAFVRHLKFPQDPIPGYAKKHVSKPRHSNQLGEFLQCPSFLILTFFSAVLLFSSNPTQ